MFIFDDKITPQKPLHYCIYFIQSTALKLDHLSHDSLNVPLHTVSFSFTMFHQRQATGECKYYYMLILSLCCAQKNRLWTSVYKRM